MDLTSQCAAVIPCLNEATTIGNVVKSVRRHISTVYVVDDGSTDDTGAIARACGAEVLRNQFPRGKGTALQSGWKHAMNHGFKWALALDGDGQHSAEDIPKFLDSAEKANSRLVIGNRMAEPIGMPWLRLFVNRWMSRRISALAGVFLPDSQCGFRLINLETWSSLPVSASHFEIESAVLLAFARHGHAIEFVPIQVIYGNERSKIHPLRDTVRWARWWWRARNENRYVTVVKKLSTPRISACALTEEHGFAVAKND